MRLRIRRHQIQLIVGCVIAALAAARGVYAPFMKEMIDLMQAVLHDFLVHLLRVRKGRFPMQHLADHLVFAVRQGQLRILRMRDLHIIGDLRGVLLAHLVHRRICPIALLGQQMQGTAAVIFRIPLFIVPDEEAARQAFLIHRLQLMAVEKAHRGGDHILPHMRQIIRMVEIIVLRPQVFLQEHALEIEQPRVEMLIFQLAEVVAVGPGGTVDGKEVVMQVKPGDKVLYSKYAGSEFKIDGNDFVIVRQADILAIVD